MMIPNLTLKFGEIRKSEVHLVGCEIAFPVKDT
jgi:hypothetical protein